MNMQKIIFTIIYCSVLLSDSITISPIIYFNYESSGSTWIPEDKTISIGGWGFRSIAEFSNFTIELDTYNNRFFGIKEKPNSFSSEQGLSWVGNNPEGEEFDFDFSNMKISYDYKSVVLEFGKFNRKWGPGVSSLTLSNKAPSFVQFGFNWKLNDNLNFEYFHGSLRSFHDDENNIAEYNLIGVEKPQYNRFIAGHRLNWSISDKLHVSASELVVYGVREIDFLYLMPFIPFLSVQQYAGDLDNIQWAMDISWKLTNSFMLYSSLLMDEWDPSMTFSKPNRNWFAYQIGIKLNSLIVTNDSLIAEYNWTDHRVYRHQNSINDYYSHDYPLGFWGGPHSEEFFINYNFVRSGSIFNISYSNASRGELTEEMLVDQYDNVGYDRFSGIKETISIFKFLFTKPLENGFDLHFGISDINWKNGKSTIEENQEILIDISKTSLSIGFSYNFDIFNQIASINQKSVSKTFLF